MRIDGAFIATWRSASRYLVVLPAVVLGWSSAAAHEGLAPHDGTHAAPPVVVPLETTEGLTLIGTQARAVTYRGRKAVELTEHRSPSDSDGLEEMALVDRAELRDGTIEVWVAGTRAEDAAADDRGFIGLAFRSAGDGRRFENIYLRPTNGRADAQIRRNHSTQYASLPDYPWYRLREQTPGQYESYVDLVAEEWTTIRIVLKGERAALYVNEAAEPALVVTDLKLGAAGGGERIGLWIGPGTRGYFSRMVVTPGGGDN